MEIMQILFSRSHSRSIPNKTQLPLHVQTCGSRIMQTVQVETRKRETQCPSG